MNKEKTIFFSKVATNNLKNINLNLPLGLLCSISGVSGSGKSSLNYRYYLSSFSKYY